VTAEHLEAPVSPTSADTATVLAAHLPTLLDEGVVGMPVWSESENVTDPDGVDEHRADALADAILATPPPEPPPSVLPPDEPPGAGTPLPWTLRRQAEKATGTDLSRVRVHSTPEGRAAADRLQARAFTAGSQIVLGRNVGHLDSGAGLRTLAHEIGHVLAPPANGKIGRDPDKPDDDADKKDKFVTWTAFQPPADTQAVIDAVPTYLESLKGVTWNQAGLDKFGADEVANGTPDDVLRPTLVVIATENYVIILADDSSVVSVEEQATAKIPPGNLAGVALAYPLKGFVWTIGDVHIPGKADSFDLRPTKARKPVDTAKPGQSLMVIYLPKVTTPPELIAKLKTPPPPKKNTSDTPGWTKDQVAKLNKVKARKAAAPPKDTPKGSGDDSAPKAGSKDGSATGQGKGDSGEGKGSGHGKGDGVGDGTEAKTDDPGDSGGGTPKADDPLKGPVNYSTWQGDHGPPQLVITQDRAWTSIPLNEDESTESLEDRADKALKDLQDSRDPAKSTKMVNGAKTTGFVQGKNDTGVAQGKAEAEAQAKSTPTAATPGQRIPGAKGGANATAYPSKMTMAGKQPDIPAVSVSGATNTFTMDLNYAALSMGFQDEVFNRMQTIQFYWEVIDVTHLTREKAELTQDQAETTAQDTNVGKGHQETGAGAMGTSIKRDMRAIAEDEQNDLKMMSDENWSWDARAEYLMVIGISNIVRTLGSIIGSFLDAVTQPLNARAIGFDDNGDYIIRCVATPLASDEAKADPDHHVIRASSVAVIPIRIQEINKRAEGGLDVEQQNLDAKQAALDKAKAAGDANKIKVAEAALSDAKNASTMGGLATLKAQIGDLKEAIRVATSLRDHRAARIPDDKWPDEEVSLSIRLIKENLTLENFLTSRTNMLEGLDKDGANVKFAEEHANFTTIGGTVEDGKRTGGVTDVRPRIVLASEETGQVTDILCMLGQTSPEGAAPTTWRLVDITSNSTHDYYSGSSPLGGKAGRDAAIRDCFRNFAENADYGRGTLAIRMPKELIAAVGPVDVDREMRSAPGKGGRFLQRLKDIGKVAAIAGLFATGGLGLAIGVVGGVSGAIVAVADLIKRSRTGHITDSPIEVVLDGLTVIAGLASVASVGTYYARGAANDLAKLGEAPPTWLKGLERTEGLLKLHAQFSIGQQIITIPYELAVAWAAAEKEPDEGKRNSMKLRAILHALESGAMTVAMLKGHDEEAPAKKDDQPLPKGSGADEAQSHADNSGPAKPATREGPVHEDGTAKPADTTTPPPVPAKKSVEDQIAEARTKAAQQVGKTNRATIMGDDETVAPEDPATAPKATLHDVAPAPKAPVKETNGAARDEAVELLKSRVGTDRQLTPRTDGKPPEVGTYGEQTSSASAAVALYDKAVAVAGGREVGLYFNPETGQFSVEIGTEHEVNPPAKEGWNAVVHLHPNPENVTTLRLPAPADISASIQAAKDSPTGTHTEFVQSAMHDGSSGMTKVTVHAGPPIQVTVEMAASGGEPPRTITADSAAAYAKEYDSESTYLGEGTEAHAWAMKDLDKFYAGENDGGQTARGTAKLDKTAPKKTEDPAPKAGDNKPTDPKAVDPAAKPDAVDKPVDPAPATTDPGAVTPPAKPVPDPAMVAARHKELEGLRPKDIRNVPRDGRGNLKWNGTLEAEYLGRPAAEEGYHWLLRDGKLQYVKEDVEPGQPERQKMKWNETTKALEPDFGVPDVKTWPKGVSTSKQKAFDDLGGSDPTTPFGKWVKLMESLGFKRSALVEGLQDPSGLTYDTVRHNLKDQPQFADAIKRWLSDRALLMERYPGTYKNVKSDDPAAMAAADRKASQQAMLDLEKVLPLKDATNWTERWYIERYGTEVKDTTTQTVTKVETQVKFDKGAAKDAGIDLTDTRVGDAVVHTATTAKPGEPAVETNTLQEIKGHSGELSPDEEAQWDDFKKLIGKDVPRTEKQPVDPEHPEVPPKPVTTHIDGARQIFLDPLGGKANADFIASQLAITPAPKIEFRVFNTKGVPRDFGPGDFARAGSKARLAAEIVTYCDS
jgi:hypothetical protein